MIENQPTKLPTLSLAGGHTIIVRCFGSLKTVSVFCYVFVAPVGFITNISISVKAALAALFTSYGTRRRDEG